MNNKAVLQDVGPDGLQIGIDQGTYEAIGEWSIGDTPDVQRLQLEPGDVLVVFSDGPMAQAHMGRLSERLSRMFPDNQVLILDRGLHIAVLGSLP